MRLLTNFLKKRTYIRKIRMNEIIRLDPKRPKPTNIIKLR